MLPFYGLALQSTAANVRAAGKSTFLVNAAAQKIVHAAAGAFELFQPAFMKVARQRGSRGPDC
jgi:hypothetical protein